MEMCACHVLHISDQQNLLLQCLLTDITSWLLICAVFKCGFNLKFMSAHAVTQMVERHIVRRSFKSQTHQPCTCKNKSEQKGKGHQSVTLISSFSTVCCVLITLQSGCHLSQTHHSFFKKQEVLTKNDNIHTKQTAQTNAFYGFVHLGKTGADEKRIVGSVSLGRTQD